MTLPFQKKERYKMSVAISSFNFQMKQFFEQLLANKLKCHPSPPFISKTNFPFLITTLPNKPYAIRHKTNKTQHESTPKVISNANRLKTQYNFKQTVGSSINK